MHETNFSILKLSLSFTHQNAFSLAAFESCVQDLYCGAETVRRYMAKFLDVCIAFMSPHVRVFPWSMPEMKGWGQCCDLPWGMEGANELIRG